MLSLQSNRVLVVDDDPDLRDMLTTVFSRAGAEVYTAADGSEALREFLLRQPDLVVLDVMMPGLDGWDTAALLKPFGEVPIIFLSGLTGRDNVVRGLELGAYDFVTKPFSVRVLLMKAQAALRCAGPAPANGQAVDHDDGYLTINLAERQVLVKGRPVNLTATDFRLLELLVRNKGRVLTHHHILRKIWGWEYQESAQYVHVYVSRLRRVLETDSRSPQYIITEHGVGYLFEDRAARVP
ncbi:MAG: response regulator transcription factor [Anaerolineae bacterium]|jgi:two-component system KDP operon response regulator KdpE